MARLVDGEWRYDVEQIENDSGEFDREETTFRDWLGEEFPAEAGRYHLYVSYACPWAHRTLITRALKGLEDAISVTVVDPIRIDDGWEFSPDKPGCTEDLHGFDYLREVYVEADPDYTGRVTVPVLWDKREETIVNNESEEIIKMLDESMTGVADRDLRLYPEGMREEIDAVIDDIYPAINNGVYRAGFATSQDAYEDAVGDVFDALGKYDDLLADQRYLLGDRLTLADVCMFTTLYRFDEVYHTHFKCNHRHVADYENLWAYTRDLYQTPGVADTCRMDHIKNHYYRTHPDIDPKGIVPVGPDFDVTAPHDRDRLAGGPPEELALRN